ncbi:hypothetical protein BDR03DRAFT_971739 [Suillus americanus]|nr:hypothetical protein BDR03DRAFT_971739 [Suillus americanus]
MYSVHRHLSSATFVSLLDPSGLWDKIYFLKVFNCAWHQRILWPQRFHYYGGVGFCQFFKHCPSPGNKLPRHFCSTTSTTLRTLRILPLIKVKINRMTPHLRIWAWLWDKLQAIYTTSSSHFLIRWLGVQACYNEMRGSSHMCHDRSSLIDVLGKDAWGILNVIVSSTASSIAIVHLGRGSNGYDVSTCINALI